MPTVEYGLGDIELADIPYRIDMATYRVRDITDFAPRAAEPGGSIIHSELGLYQPYMKNAWTHGFGFQWEEDALGYMNTEGELDTRHAGMVMMMTTKTDDSSNYAMEGFVSGDIQSVEYTLAWGPNTRKRTAAGTWSAINDSDGGAIGTTNDVMETQNYVHICVDGAKIISVTKSDGSSAETGANANATDYKWLHTHAGYIYAGKDDKSLIFRDSNEDLSALYGDAADDPDRIVIGGDLPTIGAVTYIKRLFVSREDGLFEIGEDNIARCALDFSDQTSSANFRSMAIHNNKLVFPIRDMVYMWNGAVLTDITPPFMTDTFPFETYGRFDNFVAVGAYLYMTARTNETTWEEHIICWDGVGWHKIAEPCTDGSDYITGMGYCVETNQLFFAVEAGATDEIYYIPFQDQSPFPYAAFATSGTHSLISSRMGMGFRRVDKSTPSITVGAQNVNSTRYLVVYYKLDGEASWHEWGGTNEGRIENDGITKLTNPQGTDRSTLEYNYMQVRIDFVTATAAQSPILEEFTLRFIMRPDELWGHNFQIVAATNLKIGTSRRDLRTVREIIESLEEARASKAPIKFVDPFGLDWYGYVASVERQAVERHGRTERGGYPDIESRVICNFVELG